MAPAVTLHLQGLGAVPAVPASELRAGWVITWNYGTKSLVIGVLAKGKSVEVVEEYNDGTRYSRLWRRERLIAATKGTK